MWEGGEGVVAASILSLCCLCINGVPEGTYIDISLTVVPEQ